VHLLQNFVMMKFIFFISSLLLTAMGDAQVAFADIDTKDWIQMYRQATISFGIQNVASFQDIDGKIVKKKIFQSIGTGICFYLRYEKKLLMCIVTAKHVIYDPRRNWTPNKIRIRTNLIDTIPIDQNFGSEVILNDSSETNWIMHPDTTVDIAALLISTKDTNSLVGIKAIPYSFFPLDEEYFEGKEIFVLGYPTAVGLDLLNRAVLRRGIIAWVPSNINTGKKILIDCNIFPGNSGGPVFSIPHNRGTFLYDSLQEQKPRFYGIVSERRFSDNALTSEDGSKIVDIKGREISTLESVGIGVIITAKKVRELLNIMQQEIDKTDAKEGVKK